MQNPTEKTRPRVPFSQALRLWCKVALLSFGGPAAQIALMHRLIVEEKKWISEGRFLHALNYCMLLPGPEAQQLAVYIGWLLHRTLGGLVAGILFILPGFVAILALSCLYAGWGQVRWVEAVFYGLAPAVLAIVFEAVVRIGKRALKNGVMFGVAAASFVAIFLLHVPFPWIIITAASLGLLGGRLHPDRFLVVRFKGADEAQPDIAISDHEAAHAQPSLGRALRVLALGLTLWWAPLLVLSATLGPNHVMTQLGWFFSKMAVVTFGGAYAVLSYVGQVAVEDYQWLQPGEMLDGLGMAETTPGPLIQVVQFVGFMAAYRQPGSLVPIWAGVMASVLVTWVTFVPCFLWIFLGAPYVERLRSQKLLTAALSCVTAAVVGVILNLAVWFALHSLFTQTSETTWGFFKITLPEAASLDVGRLGVTLAAFVMVFGLKLGLVRTLTFSVLLGAAAYYVLAGT